MIVFENRARALWKGREVVVAREYAGLITLWHRLACQSRDCCIPQGIEGVVQGLCGF